VDAFWSHGIFLAMPNDTLLADVAPGEFGAAFDASPLWEPGPSLPVKRGVLGTIGTSLARGTDQLQATGFGLGAVIADTLGADEFAKSFLRGYTRNMAEAGQNPAEVGTFRNIEDAGTLGTYITEAVFENLPNMAASFGAGGVGAMAAKGGVSRAVAERMAGEAVAKRFLASKAGQAAAANARVTGATIGSFAANVGQETGSIAGDIYERTGEIKPGQAILGGLAAGAVESLGDTKLIKQVFGEAVEGQLKKGLARRIGEAGAVQFLKEGGTEAIQTVIEEAAAYHAENQPDKPFWTPQMVDSIVDAALKGGLAGAAFGGGAQVVEEVRRKEQAGELRAAAERNRQLGNTRTAAVLDQQADEVEFQPASLEQLKGGATTTTPEGKTVVVNRETGTTEFPPVEQPQPVSPTASAPTPAASAPPAGAPAPVADVPRTGEPLSPPPAATTPEPTEAAPAPVAATPPTPTTQPAVAPLEPAAPAVQTEIVEDEVDPNATLPDLDEVEPAATPAEPKNPWQMTRDDFVKAHGRTPKGMDPSDPRAIKSIGARIVRLANGDVWNTDEHGQEVYAALLRGAPVPAEVLADYPELTRPTSPPSSAPTDLGAGAASPRPVAGPETNAPAAGMSPAQQPIPTDAQLEQLTAIKTARDSWKRPVGGPIYAPLSASGVSKSDFSNLKKKGWVEDRGFGPTVTVSGLMHIDPEFRKSLESIGRPTRPEDAIPAPTPTPSTAKLDAIKAKREAIAAKMRAKARNLSAGLDPEYLTLTAELATTYIEEGVVRFADFARKVRADLPDLWDKTKGYLRGAWNAVADQDNRIAEVSKEQSLGDITAAETVDTAQSVAASTAGNPDEQAIQQIEAALKAGPVTRGQVNGIIARTHGGTLASGAVDAKQLTDLVEAAINRIILADQERYGIRPGAASAQDVVARLKLLVANAPTQTTRTEEQNKMQQFSTPPFLGYVANWVANITSADVVLEPSAGIGGLAVFAKSQGATVIGNELSERRSELLKLTGSTDHVRTVNAEQLHARMAPEVASGALPQPTVVVMNPPFSNAANTSQSNTLVGAKHVEQALELLPPGGRLVAIVGEGMADDRPRFKNWWAQTKRKYNVRANIGVSGDEYRKYGTTFGNNLLVIDKTGPTPEGETTTGSVAKVEDLIPLLEGIKNDRPRIEPTTAQPGGGAATGAGAGDARPGVAAPVATGSPGTRGGRRGKPASNPSVGIQPGSQGGNATAGVGNGTDAGGSNQPAAATVERLDTPRADTGPAEGLKVETRDDGKEVTLVGTDGVFAVYQPAKLKIEGAKPHPTELVESASMASTPPVDPNYRPSIPQSVITNGDLSEAQIEQVVYAGQAHEQILPSGERQGYFVGDGTGVGKGRIISGVFLDNWNQGRKKGVWISKTKNLINDAKRDLGALGLNPDVVLDMAKKPVTFPQSQDGIAFLTYTGLSKNNPGLTADNILLPSDKANRMRGLLDWLGADFDGVIALDEVHLAGSAVSVKGTFGSKDASQRALAVVDLQRLFPKARILYVSATGATDITNLGYGDRLGIWGAGKPFATKQDFFTKITAGGISAMEIVARDLKALGSYLARTLSFRGVEQEQVVHALTPEQRTMYDEIAAAWQMVFANVDTAMGDSGANNNSQARSRAMGAFWGAEQRFFNQLLTALQMPSVLAEVRKDLEAGRSAVLQVVNTNEATLNRELAEQDEDKPTYEDLDLTPKDILLSYVDKSFPTTLYEPKEDADGNVRYAPVLDDKGNPVQDPKAVALKNETLAKLSLLKVPTNPMEQLLDTFGADAVAEVTGRSRRVVWGKDENGRKIRVKEERNESRRKVETDEFNAGKRRILVFSDAGGTGFSYHAGVKFKNQERRAHYVIQAGWRADTALQGMGRTHRSDQVHPPIYKLVSTDLKGHQRFISTIARRLNQLGALVSGERKSAGSGMFSEEQNLENDYAQSALDGMFIEAWRGKLPGVKFDELARNLGFIRTRIDPQTGEKVTDITLIDPKTGGLNFDKLPDVPQFLNRILALPVDQQNHVFNLFMERLQSKVEVAKQQGTYDPGTQERHALAIRVTNDETAYTHPSGATTRLVDVDVDEAVKRASWQDVSKMTVQQFVRNKKSGHIYGLIEGPNITDDKGIVSATWRRIGVRGHTLAKQSEVKIGPNEWNNYEAVSKDAAEPLWNQDFAKTPDRSTTQETYIVGAFLPIWDRIGLSRPRIYRLNTDKGNFLGAQVPAEMVPEVRRRLGASQSALTPTDLFRGLNNGERFEFANGWTLKRSKVLNEWRIEAIGVEYAQRREWNNFIGGYTEQIQWQERFFLPNDEAQATAALAKILEKTPVLQESSSPTTDAAIAALDRLQQGLDGKTYSDPFLLTPIAKLALKLAKALLQAGRTLEVAIREAIAQAKAQMPGEVVDEAQLATAMREGIFAMAPEPAAQAAPYTGETKESKAMRLLTPIQYRSTTDAESEQLAKDFIDRVHGGDLREALRAARYPDPLSGIDERFAAFVGSEVMNRATELGLANNDAALIKLGGEAKEFTQAILSKGAQATQAGNRIKNRSMASAAVLDLWARSVDLIDQELAKRFPDVTSHNIKAWLTEAGRQAVKEMAQTMTRTNAVTSRVLRIVGRDAGVDWSTLFTSSAANQLQWQRDLFNRIREHPKLQNLSEAQAAELTNILTEAWQRERMKIFRREFRKQVILPEVKPSDAAKLEAAVPELIKQLNLGLLENEAFRNALAPRYGKQPVTLAEARELHAEAQAAQAKPVGLQREQAMRSVLDKMRLRSGIPRWEYVQGWWYASVLSGMGTQGRNILGNASVLADNMLASTARDIASGRPQATLARVGAMLRGMRENVTSGEFGAIFLEGKVSAREGMDIAQASNVLELAAKEAGAWKWVLRKGRYVTRFMLAVDSFFYDAAAEVAAVNEIIARNKTATWPEVQQEIFDKLNLSPEKRAAAEAKAKAEGVTGRDFNRRVIEILEQDRPSEILDAQHRFALEATLNNEPQGLLGLIAKATLSARKAFPPLVAVVPFVRISANVGNLLLQHSPFGLYYTLANWSNQGQGWEGRRGGAWSGKLIGIRPDLTPEEYQQLRAKVFLSHAALVMLFAWAASESDEDEPLMQVTGSMQGINPDKRRQLEEQGIRPYSIKFGGRSFDYRQTPWAVAFATVGNWMDGQRYEDQWDEKAWLVKTANAAAGGKMVVLDQNFLSNLMVFLDRGPQLAKDQNASKLLAFAGRTVGGAVPAMGKEVESWFAPDVRKAVTSWDYVQREFPILRQSVGVPVVNVLGEPVQRPRYPWSWLTSEASEDPVWQALGEKAQKGVFVPVPSAAATILQNGKRVKMTPEQFAKYQAEVGKLYRAKLTRDLARFERMTPEQAAEYFKREFEPLREQARMRVR